MEMNGEMMSFMAVHGLMVGILSMLGLYLLASKRSAFHSNVEPNYLVRRIAGVNALLWAFSFSITFLSPLVFDSPNYVLWVDLDIMLCLLLLPGTFVLLAGLLQMQNVIRRYSLLSLVLPAFFFCCRIMCNDRLYLFMSVAYWALFASFFVFWFVRQEHKYHLHLYNLYSTLEHHEIRWAYRIMWIFMIYLMLFFIAHLFPRVHYSLYYISYAFCLCLWFVLTYYIDSHECVAHFWTSTSEAPRYEVETDESKEALRQDVEKKKAEEQAQKGQNLSWIGERLLKKCEEEKLYLRQDLSVDTLASYIGTNRTYIGRYLSSRGLTYYSYINGLRVAYAKQLIQNSPKQNMSDIALQCGFKSDSTFRRAFSEVEKCSPSEYARILSLQ